MTQNLGRWKPYVGFIGAAVAIGTVAVVPWWASMAHGAACAVTGLLAGLLAVVSYVPLRRKPDNKANLHWLYIIFNCLPLAIALAAVTIVILDIFHLWRTLQIGYTFTPWPGLYCAEVLFAAWWLLVVINLRQWWRKPPYANRLLHLTAWLWPMAAVAFIALACSKEDLQLPSGGFGRRTSRHFPPMMVASPNVGAYTPAVFSSLLVFLWSWLIFWCAWPLCQKHDDGVPHCIECGYDLRGTVAAGRTACPECGKEVIDESM